MSDRGFLLIDKPGGMTSHDVVARVRRAINIDKVGHAGTLDPLATGLLVCGVGPATKLIRFVQDLPKEYVGQIQFGVATDSLDADGEETYRRPMTVTAADLDALIGQFTGTVYQVPPMVSALKVEGRRLHELARQGIEVEREARPVEIYSLQVLDVRPQKYSEAVIRVVCAKGTYVRVLADDLAKALGGRAHLKALRRLKTGSLSVEHAITLERLDELGDAGRWDTALLSPYDALASLPHCLLRSEVADRVRNGARLAVEEVPGPWTEGDVVRLADTSENLLAVHRLVSGTFVPEVVLP